MNKNILIAICSVACFVGLSVRGSFPSHRKALCGTSTNTSCPKKASLEILEGKNRWQIAEAAATERVRILAESQRDVYAAINQEQVRLCQEQQEKQDDEKALMLRQLSCALALFNDAYNTEMRKVDWRLLEPSVKHPAISVEGSKDKATSDEDSPFWKYY